MSHQTLYLWKQAPFLRLLVPLAAGIMLQWYNNYAIQFYWLLFFFAVASLVIFNLRISFLQYKLAWLTGLFINTIFIALGMLLTWHSSIIHQPHWMGEQYRTNTFITVTLEEPLSEKANSFKANAAVQQLILGDTITPATGNIIVYFRKDSSVKKLGYGTQLVFNKTLQPIKKHRQSGFV